MLPSDRRKEFIPKQSTHSLAFRAFWGHLNWDGGLRKPYIFNCSDSKASNRCGCS